MVHPADGFGEHVANLQNLEFGACLEVLLLRHGVGGDNLVDSAGINALDSVAGYRDDGAAPTLIKVGTRTTFRHIVSNLSDVLAAIGSREWPLALGGHLHTRESISFGSTVRTRFHQAAAVVGPTENAIPAVSGVTLYRVKNRVIDDGEFVPVK